MFGHSRNLIWFTLFFLLSVFQQIYFVISASLPLLPGDSNFQNATETLLSSKYNSVSALPLIRFLPTVSIKTYLDHTDITIVLICMIVSISVFVLMYYNIKMTALYARRLKGWFYDQRITEKKCNSRQYGYFSCSSSSFSEIASIDENELAKSEKKRRSFLLGLEAVKLLFIEADWSFHSGFEVKDALLFEGRFRLNPDTDRFTDPVTGRKRNGVEMMVFYMDWIIKHRDDISAEDIIDHFEDERGLLSVSHGLKHNVDAISPGSGFVTPLLVGSSEHSQISSSEYVTASSDSFKSTSDGRASGKNGSFEC